MLPVLGLANAGRMIWLPPSLGATLPQSNVWSQTKNDSLEPSQILSDTVRSTNTLDGRILLDFRHGQMFSVNAVGAKILEFLEQGQDEPRIAEEISRAYAANIEVVRPDVHDFIEALHKHDIVQANDSVDSNVNLHHWDDNQ